MQGFSNAQHTAIVLEVLANHCSLQAVDPGTPQVCVEERETSHHPGLLLQLLEGSRYSSKAITGIMTQFHLQFVCKCPAPACRSTGRASCLLNLLRLRHGNAASSHGRRLQPDGSAADTRQSAARSRGNQRLGPLVFQHSSWN